MESCWGTPFEESMLDLPKGVVIHCPNRELAFVLFEIFRQRGIGKSWSDSEWKTANWDKYREETAYYVKDRSLLFGPRATAERMSSGFFSYAKCTFSGSAVSDFEIADDSEFAELLGIGGG